MSRFATACAATDALPVVPWLRLLTRAFRRPFRHLRRHWRAIAIGLALVPVHAAAVLSMPSLLGGALDQISAGGTADALATTCWILLALAVVEALSRFGARKLLIDASREVERSLKDELARHLQRLPIAWFDRARTGDITARMTQDVELVRFVNLVGVHGWRR